MLASYLRMMAQMQALRIMSWRGAVISNDTPVYFAASAVGILPILHAGTFVTVLYALAGRSIATYTMALLVLALALAISVSVWDQSLTLEVKAELERTPPAEVTAIRRKMRRICGASIATFFACLVI